MIQDNYALSVIWLYFIDVSFRPYASAPNESGDAEEPPIPISKKHLILLHLDQIKYRLFVGLLWIRTHLPVLIAAQVYIF